MSAHCLLRQKDYAASIGESRRMLELIEAFVRSGDTAHRDAEIEHLRAPMKAGTLPKEAELQAIRRALRPRILIPMHYELRVQQRSLE